MDVCSTPLHGHLGVAPNIPTILEQAQDLQDELIGLRRELHSYPELSFQEVRTTGIIQKRLATCGYTIKECGDTGVLAEVGAGKNIIALHTEIDGLPIQESLGAGWASKNDSVMHACGHDANMACVVGAARIMARKLRRSTSGKLRIIAQPGGERRDRNGKSGASRMILAGALADVAVVLGLHVDTTIKTGYAGIRTTDSDVFMDGEATSTLTNAAAAQVLNKAASDVLGANNVNFITRNSWGVDFLHYARRVPAAYIHLGAMIPGNPRPHHTDAFAINEKCLCNGAAILAEAAAGLFKVLSV